MTLWEFMACMDGVRRFHSGKKDAPKGDIEEDRLRDLGIEGF
jgi:hypothetical protein